MLTLKNYQNHTLDKVSTYLERTRLLGDPGLPFAEQQEAQGYPNTYRPLKGLEKIPFVCLRLPTGGGKTLLSAHTVRVAAESYLETDFPLVLWLAPTDTIRKQTLETLKNPRHPNRQALDAKYDGKVRVFDITDFAQLRPQDIGEKVCIFVATFGAFRVNSTDGRKVYANNEELEPHFAKIPPAKYHEIDEKTGKIKLSFANLMAHHRPLVIVDEAHNHATKLSVEVLNRLRAAAVIEFTATPAADSNVLYKVSASELKTEDMIKLPVRLTEHLSWTDAVTSAIQKRTWLESMVAAENEYIRPIVLFQAQPRDGEVTVEVLLKHLTEQEGLDRETIAIATGEQRELDGINLFDTTCPIQYIITIQALKEGWDCSFAYVFCSVAKVQSSRDAEQLLGRVLRMPYAKRRNQDDLNRAYAHVPVTAWTEAVGRIRDNMVSMGFEEQEAVASIQYELPLNAQHELQAFREQVVVYSTESPNISVLTLALQADAEVQKTEEGYKVTFSVTSEQDARELRDKARELFCSEAAQTSLVQELGRSQAACRPLSPSELGQKIIVPQLCLDFGDGDLRAAEKEDFLVDGPDLLAFPPTLEAFQVVHEEHIYELDVQGTKLRERALSVQETLHMPGGMTHWTETTLIGWLDRRLQQPDIPYTHMVEFLRRHINHLAEHRRIPLAELVRLRFLLEKMLREKIAVCRKESYKTAIQHTLFEVPQTAKVTPDVAIVLQNGQYPVNRRYQGSFQFTKHFFPLIAEMDGEEIECAKSLDMHPKVKSWVRNLERQPRYAFWLPTHDDRFYPDFVAELTDGRILVVEYKGKPYETNDDSKEKAALGQLWAERSGGKCLFLMAVKRDASGRNVWGQLEATLDC